MTKRIAAALIAATLLFGCALSEELSRKFTTKHFTLGLPVDWLISADGLEQSEDSWELGYLYRSGDTLLCIASQLDYYSDWADVSLWRNDPDDMDEYVASLLKQLDEYGASVMETVEVGRIPFVILECTMDGCLMYYAETMTNGYAVSFQLYAMDDDTYESRDVTREDYELFVRILDSFEPII